MTPEGLRQAECHDPGPSAPRPGPFGPMPRRLPAPTLYGMPKGPAPVPGHPGPPRRPPVVPTPDRLALEDHLVRSHLPLAEHIVSQMAARVPRHVPRDDLRSAALAGLAEAARGFDPTRGHGFAGFAARRVRGAVLDELRARDWAPRSLRAQARAVERATERLTGALGRTPATGELALHMGISSREVSRVDQEARRASILSLAPLSVDGDVNQSGLQQGPGADEPLLRRELYEHLAAALHQLPPRLRRVVTGYYFEDKQMAALGAEMCISESRVSQLCSEALALMKDAINAQLEPELVRSHPSPVRQRRREDYFDRVAAQGRRYVRQVPVPALPAVAAAVA